MMNDTFEGLEDDDLEEEADKEVDKVLFEITNGEMIYTHVLLGEGGSMGLWVAEVLRVC